MVEWKEQLQHSQSSNEHSEVLGIHGEPFKFEWHTFPGHPAVQILQER